MVSDTHAQPPVEQNETKPAPAAPSTVEAPAAAPTKETKTMATKKKQTKKTSKKAAKAKNGTAKKVSTAKRDEFGLRDGSKASQAAGMFARQNGATMAQVKEKTGGTVYNLLKKLADAGHKVTNKEGTITLRAK